MTKIPPTTDPTLDAVNRSIEAIENAIPQRDYMGMSNLAEPCARKLFYQFRHAKAKDKKAKLIKCAEDGHASELVQAARLRMVDGVTLHTVDPDTGKQFEYTWLNNAIQGHADGKITGLIQAPRTEHIWEHKACNQKKYDAFTKCKDEFGEKECLKNWDIVYYGQAMLYLHFSGLSRHYLTVSLPGCRETQSCRTEANPTYALELLERAKKIIYSDSAPNKIHESPSWFYCKHFCDYYAICHTKEELPQLNCRTCLHSTPETAGGWSCAKLNEPIGSVMACGGEMHLYLPDMLGGKAVDFEDGMVKYEDGRINYEGGRVE